jgi:cell filamentation protein
MTADRYHDDAGVLFNKLGITNARELREYDLLAGELNARPALAYADRQPRLGMDALCGIHEILFSELYPWAGKPRQVSLIKGETTFADPVRINGWLDGTMRGFTRAVEATPENLTQFMAELWGRMNWLHPFPEGNGRATQIFMTAVAHRYGQEIDWRRITRNAELTAAKRSVKYDFGGYHVILIDSLRPIQTGERTTLLPFPGRSE